MNLRCHAFLDLTTTATIDRESEKLFFEKLEHELLKVNKFFETKVEEMTRNKLFIVERLRDFLPCRRRNDLEPYTNVTEDIGLEYTATISSFKSTTTRKRRKDLAFIKKFLLEYYRALLLLLSYQKMNYLSLSKILKKFDKV